MQARSVAKPLDVTSTRFAGLLTHVTLACSVALRRCISQTSLLSHLHIAGAYHTRAGSLLCSKAVHSHFILQLLCLVFELLCAYLNDRQAFASLLSLANPGPERILHGAEGQIQQILEGRIIGPILCVFIDQRKEVLADVT